MADAIQKCWHPIKETIIPFGVGRNFCLVVAKAFGYRGKLVRLYLPENFSSMEVIRSLFHAPENLKMVPLELTAVVCASELYCEKKALTK